MIFKFPKKKIVVDCFTSNYNAYTHYPISLSKNYYPTWWKNVQSKYKSTEYGIKLNRPTIKKCMGILDLYSNSLSIPLWSDLILETNDNQYRYIFADKQSSIVQHTNEQMGENAYFGKLHLKFISPWAIKESQGIKFSFVQSSWNLIEDLNKFHILPGVLDFKYQNHTHINMLAETHTRCDLSAGTPLVIATPLSEKEIEIKCHLVDELELGKIVNTGPSTPWFNNTYKKQKGKTND